MRMKNIVMIMMGAMGLVGCGSSIKLTIPETFRQQATMQHVNGARGNRMSFSNFTTSKIKRGIHVVYPGWGRGFILENLLWNQIGIQKSETVRKEKAKFRYAITDGKNMVEVYAHENEVTKKHEYEIVNEKNPFPGLDILQQYKYVFSAFIRVDTAQESRHWELLMTNIYDREAENDKNPFTYIRKEDNGLATNGIDTIYIKALSIQKTESPDGKIRRLPVKLLSGYELSTPGGVIAIIDMINRNIWFYNELDPAEKLNVSAIATAIFARKVRNAQW